MGIRRKAREIALHCLYQSEMTATAVLESFPQHCANFEVNQKAVPYAQELVEGVVAQWDAINRLIQENAAHWRLERMSVIDRNIMRIAIFELCFREDVPANVAINEAIEVAKRFSTDDAPPFINGILDAVKKKLDSQQEKAVG